MGGRRDTRFGVDAESERQRWDQRYESRPCLFGREPSAFLRERIETLPGGEALVLAMGEGRNALYLAELGYEVTGVDISPVAAERCLALAEDRGLSVSVQVADLADYAPAAGRYDLITNFYYLERGLFAKIPSALRPGGVFVLETFSIDHLGLDTEVGPSNPDFLLRPNEALEALSDLRILFYEDVVLQRDDLEGKGPAALIRLIAKK